MTTLLTIFRRFPTTFRRFPKIFPNLSEGQTNVSKYSPNILRRLPKISEDCRRLPKIAEEEPIMFRSYSKTIQIHQSAYHDRWQFKTTTLPRTGMFVWSCYTDWVDLNRRAYLKCLWLSFLHRSCWESWSCNFRIAFLEKLWKDWALIRMGHGYISSGSGAGIFEVRNYIV